MTVGRRIVAHPRAPARGVPSAPRVAATETRRFSVKRGTGEKCATRTRPTRASPSDRSSTTGTRVSPRATGNSTCTGWGPTPARPASRGRRSSGTHGSPPCRPPREGAAGGYRRAPGRGTRGGRRPRTRERGRIPAVLFPLCDLPVSGRSLPHPAPRHLRSTRRPLADQAPLRKRPGACHVHRQGTPPDLGPEDTRSFVRGLFERTLQISADLTLT